MASSSDAPLPEAAAAANPVAAEKTWLERQRERKLSRAKGLLSTPGLPDTPAVAAAHAKMAATGVPLPMPR